MKKAIHFGAGNIGRGFIGFLLNRSNYHVTFIDIDEEIIQKLHDNKKYQVRVVGSREELTTITNVDGILSSNISVPERIADADIVTCAIGPNVLSKISGSIRKGIAKRKHMQKDGVLYIIACENMVRASTQLKKYVIGEADKELKAYINERVAFLDSGVDRIVPISKPDEHLTVTVEEFFEWCIEDIHIKEDFHRINDAHFVSNLQPYIERKLFTLNTAHAFTAWLGFLCGYTTINECMKNESIKKHVQNICQETAEVLIRKHTFDRNEHTQYIDSIIKRFENKYISDEISRIGRSPIRKLSRSERFVAPLMLAREYETKHTELLLACACGLKFVQEDDNETKKIQAMLKHQSPKEVFLEISGLQNIDIAVEVELIYNKIEVDNKNFPADF